MDGSSLLGGDAIEMAPMPAGGSGEGSALSEVLIVDGAQEDHEDWVIKRPDGTRWTTQPTNTWSLYKFFVTII